MNIDAIETQLVINRASDLIHEFHEIRDRENIIISELLDSLQEYADLQNKFAEYVEPKDQAKENGG